MRAQAFVEKIPFYRGIGWTICSKRLALGAWLRRFQVAFSLTVALPAGYLKSKPLGKPAGCP